MDERTPEDRLETALERIARGLDAADPIAAEVATRLDALIGKVRDAARTPAPASTQEG